VKGNWQKHVIVSSGYRELGMFDDAANALEEIEPEDKTRKEVLGSRIDLYMAARKWDMAAAVAESSGEGRARRSSLVDQFGLCDTPGRERRESREDPAPGA
jgi:lipopolysaccharide biosynthesis regulator YciM